MTSNIGSEEFNMEAQKIGFATSDKDEERIITDYNDIRDKVLKQLPDFFAPEFLNRIDKTVVFSPLDKKVMKNIITLQLGELIERLTPLGITLTYDTKVITQILTDTYNPEYGARPVRRYIQDQLEDVIADQMLERGKKKTTVALSVVKGKIAFVWK
jgi:ATP-dependent Clp protease ATP-binding subunit ClpC